MIGVDADRCVGCGSCVAACPRGAIALVDALATVDQARCDGCGLCVEACGFGAIRSAVEVLRTPRMAEVVRAPSRQLTVDVPSAVRRLMGYLAPIALELAVGLLERRLSGSRAATGRGGSVNPQPAATGARRRWRRGWRL